MLGQASTPPLPMDRVTAYELEIYGSHGMAAHEYPAMLSMIANGDLNPSALVGEVIGLGDIPAALAAMDAPSPTVGLTVARLRLGG